MKLLLSAALASVVLVGPGFAQQPAPAPAEQAAPAPAASSEGEAPAADAAATPAAEGEAAPATIEGDAEPAAEATGAADGEKTIEGAEPGQAPQSSGTTEAAASGDAAEAHETVHYPMIKPEEMSWSFAGPFGKWDIGQLQRGLKVYREVCSSCHSMELVSFRNLEALGYSDAQVRALAAEYQIIDPLPSSTGEEVERPGIPSDRFPSPFPNREAAAASNGGAYPPDFSLLAKARTVERGFPTFVFDIFTQYAEGGPDYIHALLTGYGHEVPEHIVIQPGTHFNPYFVGGPALAMAAPLSDDQVTYDDGAPQTVDQYSRDVAAFMMWAAEPHLVERKATGFVVLIFLVIFGGLVYVVKSRVWAGTPH